jgi:hypothetical protein
MTEPPDLVTGDEPFDGATTLNVPVKPRRQRESRHSQAVVAMAAARRTPGASCGVDTAPGLSMYRSERSRTAGRAECQPCLRMVEHMERQHTWIVCRGARARYRPTTEFRNRALRVARPADHAVRGLVADELFEPANVAPPRAGLARIAPYPAGWRRVRAPARGAYGRRRRAHPRPWARRDRTVCGRQGRLSRSAAESGVPSRPVLDRRPVPSLGCAGPSALAALGRPLG